MRREVWMDGGGGEHAGDDLQAPLVDGLREGLECEPERLGEGGEAFEQREGGAIVVRQGGPAGQQRRDELLDVARRG